MQMLLALQRFPFLQSYFDKGVSLSGVMDLHITIAKREGMRQMFVNDFGLVLGENQETWLDFRSPVKHCEDLDFTFPLLLIQGTEDQRVHLSHGHEMYAELERLGNDVTYWEVEGGNHCLSNYGDLLERVTSWLESSSMNR